LVIDTDLVVILAWAAWIEARERAEPGSGRPAWTVFSWCISTHRTDSERSAGKYVARPTLNDGYDRRLHKSERRLETLVTKYSAFVNVSVDCFTAEKLGRRALRFAASSTAKGEEGRTREEALPSRPTSTPRLPRKDMAKSASKGGYDRSLHKSERRLENLVFENSASVNVFVKCFMTESPRRCAPPSAAATLTRSASRGGYDRSLHGSERRLKNLVFRNNASVDVFVKSPMTENSGRRALCSTAAPAAKSASIILALTQAVCSSLGLLLSVMWRMFSLVERRSYNGILEFVDSLRMVFVATCFMINSRGGLFLVFFFIIYPFTFTLQGGFDLPPGGGG